MTGFDTWRRWATIAAAVGSGLAGGVFLAYSTFTMRAVRRLPPHDGIATMQAINRAADRSAGLMATLFGTAALTAVLGVAAVRDRSHRSDVQLLAGAIYLVAVVGMTVAFHVPRNDALAVVEPAAAGSTATWREYARAWTAGNHVRTLGALVAALLYTWSLSGPPAGRPGSP